MLRTILRGPALALSVCLCATTATRAQTTDGYHAIQVLPVVVDTASFTQRITIRNPYQVTLTLFTEYYPAEGTAQTTPMTCNMLGVNFRSAVTFDGLRSICPGLAPGSNFGTLVIRSTLPRAFSVYSRVSNAQGAGFSVEGFAAHTFNPGVAAVTGLRRLAATATSPAYQSNCFVGSLVQYNDPDAPAVDVNIEFSQDNVFIGFMKVAVKPGQLIRLLDVFAAAGMTQGDLDDVTVRFGPATGTLPALIAFCTVQDNTSFGADFRIGKTELGTSSQVGWNDNTVVRTMRVGGDYQFPGSDSVRPFAIPAGASRNVHTLYFRHPDIVSCGLLDPQTEAPLVLAYGLELRLLAMPSGGTEWQAIAGGNDTTSFGPMYLGDKGQFNDGFSSRYLLEVESNGRNVGASRPYKLACSSGSGHTQGELTLTGAATAF